MTWFGAAENKRDKLTDSLDAFWGKGAENKLRRVQMEYEQNNISIAPQQIEMQNQPQTPQQAYAEYQSTGNSIKEAVEQNIKQTQDLTPDARAAVQMNNVASFGEAQQKNSNPFDIGGFDAMIQKQLARERGPGVGYGIGMGMGAKKQNWPERLAKETTEFKVGAMKQNYQDELRYKRLAMMDFARQSRAKNLIAQETARNYREAANRQRMMVGLPVYESPWDIIAGGKRKVPKYEVKEKKDKEGNVTEIVSVVVGQELQRYGGIFGAARELAPGVKKVGKGISNVYDKGYKALSNYNEKRIMNDLNKTVNSVSEKYTDTPTKNKFTITPKVESRSAPLGRNSESYGEEIEKSINDAMEEINEVKDLRDV